MFKASRIQGEGFIVSSVKKQTETPLIHAFGALKVIKKICFEKIIAP
jgi:hypothetical protein